MNIFKLIRGFCKVSNLPYRQMKKDYNKMKPAKKTEIRKKLQEFWNLNTNVLNHKKYYDLKIPLKVINNNELERDSSGLNQDHLS